MSPKVSAPTEIIRHDTGSEELFVLSATVAVTAGPDRGKSCELRQGSLVVGSDARCDLVLSDPAISSRQLELQANDAGFVLRDLGSTNGTFVGQVRISEASLTAATTIQAGRTKLKFSPGKQRQGYLLSKRHRFGSLYGTSPLMRHCFALLERAANTDSTVLIEGESGTGKELAARSLHEASSRADGPFEIVDCGAMPAELIESALFGHVKGAFTGASDDHVGATERADGGTLFLDELGELDLELQPKLLRFLEQREVRRVGATNSRRVNVRVLAATNRRIDELVADGRFREDLFYRLAVLRVTLPPLRRRPEDIALLARELGRRVRPDIDPLDWLDASAVDVLGSHHWPGNVRELRNVIERFAAIPDLPLDQLIDGAADEDEAPMANLSQLPYHDAKERVLDAFERRYVAALLEQEQGVVAKAASRAGVPRQTFFRLIRKHGLRDQG